MGMVVPQSSATSVADSGNGDSKLSEHGSIMADDIGTTLACMSDPNRDHAAAPGSCNDGPLGQNASEPTYPSCTNDAAAQPIKRAARWADCSLSDCGASNYQASQGAVSVDDEQKHEGDSGLQVNAGGKEAPTYDHGGKENKDRLLISVSELWSSHDLAAVLDNIMLELSSFNVHREAISMHLKNGLLEVCVRVPTRKAVAKLHGWCTGAKGTLFVASFVAFFEVLGVHSAEFFILRDK
jgi:hypothetical protein